ncbi:hypothetical protein PWG71_15420 [Nocardiopsis sp. N85]|uniref:hypothetical protein n=1 Tax=Nocardiopsis sp. N85 TaxID=3029400 RepID=UPI00237F31E4|nr:hypothetical protein [Nocardiopsis sp. N85]MDE3722777.1 hypothetical protein [Nocardiopsis sp. N85]
MSTRLRGDTGAHPRGRRRRAGPPLARPAQDTRPVVDGPPGFVPRPGGGPAPLFTVADGRILGTDIRAPT